MVFDPLSIEFIEFLVVDSNHFITVITFEHLRMNLNTGRNRILLHLKYYDNRTLSINKEKVPFELCQKGISESVNLSLGRTSFLLKDMKKKGLLDEKVSRVKENTKKQKVYFLTGQGMEKARNLKEKIEKEEVTIHKNGSEQNIQIKNIHEFIDGKNPVLLAMKNLEKENEIFLDSTNGKKDVFVGRDKEMKTLLDLFDKVERGDGQTVLIKGRAGIGKTRLIKEFKKEVISDEVSFFTGKGYYNELEPYLPFKEAFESLQNEGEDPILEFENEHIIDAYPEKLNDKRDLIFSRSVKNLKSIVKNRPIIIFIDDIQWADRATLRFFHYIADKLRDEKILIIGAYRPEESNNHTILKDVLQRMKRQNILSEIELSPLQVNNTKEITKGLLGNTVYPDNFIDFLHDVSEGNPLFLKELIKQLVDSNKINPKNNEFPLEYDEINPPPVINDLIMRRISKLDQQNMKILRISSVIGEDIPFSLLSHICKVDSLELLEDLNKLCESGLLEKIKDGDKFRFVHGLVNQTVYQNIPNPLKEDLHRMVAENLIKIFEDVIEEYYSKIGFHFKNSGDISKALRYYKKAGERAEGLYAHEDALEFYKEAYDLSEKDGSKKDKKDILEKIGDINKTIGNYQKSLDHYEKILALNLDTQTRQRIKRKIASVYERKGEFEKTIDTVKEAISYSEEENIETCRLFYRKGMAEQRQGKNSTAIDDFLEALEICHKFKNPEEYSEIYYGLATAHLYQGELDESLYYSKKSLKIWRDLNDLDGQASSLNNIGSIYLNKGEISKALDNYNSSLEIRKKIGDKRDISSVLNNLGTAHSKRGDLEKAIEYYQKSQNIWEDIGDQRGIAVSLINIGVNYMKRGDHKTALDKLEKCLEISEKINFEKGIIASMTNIGSAYFKIDEAEEAKDNYEKSVKLCLKVSNEYLLIYPLIGLAEIFIQNDDIEKSLEKSKKALEIANKLDIKTEKGICHRTIGIAYRVKNDLERAEKEFKKAKKLLSSTSEKKELAELHYEYGLLFKDMDDEEKWEEHTFKAQSMFEDMGMKIWVERCENVLESI